MLWRLLRRLVLLALVAVAVYLAAGRSRFAASMTLIGCLTAILTVTVWLPRAAHKTFDRGDFGRSALYYHILRWLVFDRGARSSIQVSLSACDLARGNIARARRRLDRVAPARLSEAARAALLNNRAYALARDDSDPAEALSASNQAIALRPEVPGFRHTRGVALLALGRIDDAIRELDAVWGALDGRDAPPLLEAERCYDLGTAWSRKGERDYARDYFERAQRAAPESDWAARAARELGEPHDEASSVALPD